MKHNFSSPVLCLALLLTGAAISEAVPTTVAMPLTGATDTDVWATSHISGLSGYPGFPGFSPWSIGSGAGGDAVLSGAPGPGGGPFPASSSIYFGGFNGEPNYDGGSLTVTDSTPITDLATLTFQVVIGEASSFDFYNGAPPVLTLNGGSTTIAPTYSSLLEVFDNGTTTTPEGEESLYINHWAFQWDLSDWYAANPGMDIESFSIAFNAVQHSQVYALQLDQGSNFDPDVIAVPEPSSALLVGVCGLGALFARRRNRRRVA